TSRHQVARIGVHHLFRDRFLFHGDPWVPYQRGSTAILRKTSINAPLAAYGGWRERSPHVSQSTGIMPRLSAASATAGIQRTRDGISFLSVTPNSPMNAGRSLRLQNS